MTTEESGFLPRSRLQSLIELLQNANYRCVGPQLRDGAIVYDTLTHVDALPKNSTDEQAPGCYRIQSVSSPRRFNWANGAQAIKPLLFTPIEPLFRVRKDSEGRVQFEPMQPDSERVAIIGARACDLAALRLQDQHFREGLWVDPYYDSRRDSLFIVAVGCTHPAATCFCASTGDGPTPKQGFDLLLDELDDGYICQSGSARGRAFLHRLSLEAVEATQWDIVQREAEQAAQAQTRSLPVKTMRETVLNNQDHALWQDIEQRCLACGNCTSVCPTCFCHAERENAALDGESSEHYREWSSCFVQNHSYITGHTIRAKIGQRYRQWLSHKIAYWFDQYGRSGCVGCGRCITWCPVGIDITAEVAVLSTED